jgi:hypothetical protein
MVEQPRQVTQRAISGSLHAIAPINAYVQGGVDTGFFHG